MATPDCQGEKCTFKAPENKCEGEKCQAEIKAKAETNNKSVKELASSVGDQMMNLFQAFAKPLSTEEHQIINDLVDTSSNFLLEDQKKNRGLEQQNLIQTEANTPYTNNQEMVSDFARLVGQPLKEGQISAIDKMISTFTKLVAGSVDDAFLGVPQTAQAGHVALLETESTSQKMNQRMAIMPEVVSGVDPMDMEPKTAHFDQREEENNDAQVFSGQFNMNIHPETNLQMNQHVTSEATKNMMRDASAGMSSRTQTVTQTPSSGASLVNEAQQDTGMDDMKAAGSALESDQPYEMMEEQQLAEDEVASSESTQMPEGSKTASTLQDDMEKNVKITQIPDHTG